MRLNILYRQIPLVSRIVVSVLCTCKALNVTAHGTGLVVFLNNLFVSIIILAVYGGYLISSFMPTNTAISNYEPLEQVYLTSCDAKCAVYNRRYMYSSCVI